MILEGIQGWVIAVIVVVVLLLWILIWYIKTMNMLRRSEVKVNEAESGIDVALTKRFDALTKMLETTKGYAKHEAETLENTIKWRNGVPKEATLEDKQQFADQLNKVASGINVVVERYPDLKANTMFASLQNAIMDTEEHLQAARRVYNSNVSFINRKIVTFPISFVAHKIGMLKKNFFEAEESKTKDVDMKF
ncbi:MAG: LemA family protein [Bacilli bacterium]